MAKEKGGTFSVTVAPAAIKAPSLIVMGATKLLLLPIKASSPMVVGYLFLPS